MIKKEWQSLLKNKFMIVVIIAIMFIPTIYTTIFLGSMWDPYGNLDELPVAVVNEDESVVYNDKTMDVGSELVKNLKEKDSLDFHFVDKDEAEKGIKDGTYYMVITIPKDFSQNATTLLDEHPKTMELEYQTNPGTNYIASKMSATAMEKIRASLQEKITKEYAETIFDQIHTLGDGLSDAADGTAQANDGIDKLIDGNDKITTNLNTLASSSLTFRDGAETLQIGLKQYTDGVVSAGSGANEIRNGLGQLNSQIPQLSNGVSQLASNSDKLNSGVSQLSSGTQAIKAGGNQMLAGLNQMSGEISKSVNQNNDKQINELQQGLTSVNQGIQDLNNSLNPKQPSQVEAALKGIGTSATNAGAQYQTMVSQVQNTSAFKSLNADQQKELLAVLGSNGQQISNDLKTVGTNAQAVGTTMNTLKTSVNQLATGANTALPTAQGTISKLYSGLGGIQTSLQQQFIPGMTSLQDGITQIDAGINTKGTGLKDGLNAYTAGVSLIDSKVPELTGGVGKLYAGSTQLADGLNTLNSNNDKLNSGVSQLADGAVKISDGASKLSEGSSTLGEGLTTLKDGTTKLHDALAEGADKVNDIHDTDSTYEMIADPVNTSETEVTKVGNNGNAMSAYMMNVALWVAAIAFCIMYPLTSHNGEVKNGFRWWLSKASVVGVVTIIQACIMIFMLKTINGFSPVELGKTIFVACLASIAYMAIMYFFNILMGKVGSFIMLIFMVVQLGSCEGTYPIQLANHMYTVLKPFMPFSYGVHAFRATISGGRSITTDVVFYISLIVVFAILTMIVFHFKAKKVNNEVNTNENEAEKVIA